MENNAENIADAKSFLKAVLPFKKRVPSGMPKNAAECALLGTLATAGGTLTSGEIAERMQMSTARIAALLRNLEEKGQVKRHKDPKDKRVIYVTLTEDGKDELSHCIHHLIDDIAYLYAKLGREKMNQFRDTILEICELTEATKCSD